jgi:hypothetical protein
MWLALILLLFSGLATANSIIYIYNVNGSVSDGEIKAQALLQLFDNGTLQITLKNLLANPASAGQLVSDLIIMGLSAKSGQTPTLTNSSGSTVTLLNVNRSGPVTTGWGFGPINGGWELCIVCPDSISAAGKTSPPTKLIIGPPDQQGQYSNANSSIDVHGPMLLEDASFTLAGVGNAPDPSHSPFGDVSLSFGPQGTEKLATLAPPTTSGVNAADIPEPSAWILVAAGLVLIAFGKKRFV